MIKTAGFAALAGFAGSVESPIATLELLCGIE